MAQRALPPLTRQVSSLACRRLQRHPFPRRSLSSAAAAPQYAQVDPDAALLRNARQQLFSLENPDDVYSPSTRRWNAAPLEQSWGSRPCDGEKLDSFIRGGIPGVMSKEGFDMSWTQYMGFMCDQLEELTSNTQLYHQPDVKSIVIETARDPNQAHTFNVASQIFNHHFFMKGMAEQPFAPDENTHQAVEKSFSTFTSLRETMIDTAMAMFGPGHVWLVRHANSKEFGLKVLATYIAGTPLSRAHYRRQARDLNTASPDEFSTPDGGSTTAGLSRLQHTSVQNQVGAFGSAKEDVRKPLGGVDIEPLLCVSTWQHVWLRDYGFRRKREFFENWWEAVDWTSVNQSMGQKSQRTTDNFYYGRHF